jgi:hypothetical protein
MARNRSRKDREKANSNRKYCSKTNSSTGTLIQKIIYLPPANEWRQPVEVSQVAITDHICTFVLVASSKRNKKKKNFAHRQLPKRYLDKSSDN